jgi:hypothetical protein
MRVPRLPWIALSTTLLVLVTAAASGYLTSLVYGWPLQLP